MKTGIHPEDYRLCVFKDMSTDYMILTKSCAPTEESDEKTKEERWKLLQQTIENTPKRNIIWLFTDANGTIKYSPNTTDIMLEEEYGNNQLPNQDGGWIRF